MKTRRNASILTLVLSVVATALAVGVVTEAGATTPGLLTALPGYPSSIAVIGHSGATGSGVIPEGDRAWTATDEHREEPR